MDWHSLRLIIINDRIYWIQQSSWTFLLQETKNNFRKGTEYYAFHFNVVPGNLLKKKKSTNILNREMAVELPEGQQNH